MESTALEKWRGPAAEVKQVLMRLPVPLHVLTGEAVDVARFCEHHFETVRDSAGRVVRPGLDQAVNGGLFRPELGAEILELQQAVAAAQTEYLLSVAPMTEAPLERADFVLAELNATLSFMFDNGVEDENDARLATLQATHTSPVSQDALAAALDDYAGLADMHRDDIAGIGGFDPAMIDEARTLAAELREQSAIKLSGTPPSAQRAALDLRNRLATLLWERIVIVRNTARFVFRNDERTLRKATSAYQRRRRADARRAKQEAEREQDAAVSNG
jgi:hypothetical protein